MLRTKALKSQVKEETRNKMLGKHENVKIAGEKILGGGELLQEVLQLRDSPHICKYSVF